MTSESVLHRLSTLVIAGCLLALGATTALVLSPSLRHALGIRDSGPEPDPPPYVAGDRIDIDPAIVADADATLVLFARSTCAVCRQTAGFYAETFTAAAARGAGTVMVTPSSDREAEVAFAVDMGLAGAQVFYVPPASIRLRTVPALLIVDREGTIREAWFGRPDADEAATITRTIAALGPADR